MVSHEVPDYDEKMASNDKPVEDDQKQTVALNGHAGPQKTTAETPNHNTMSGDVPGEFPKRASVRESVAKEVEEEQVLNKAPDGGWGWVVVFGSFMIHVIADGVAYSFGIYVESFLEYFDASRSEVGFLGSLMLGVTWGTGPIASMLTNKYGCRKVTIVGTIIAACGFIISIFAPNIYFMYFSFGIVAGFGLGMAYLPAIVSVSFYFEKRRSLATGLAVCGSGVGTFVFAPVTQLLLDEYGWKGTVLIESGILLNCILCGAVFRPLPATTYAVHDPDDDSEKGSIQDPNKGKEATETKVVANGFLKDIEQPLFSSSSSSLTLRKQAMLANAHGFRKSFKSESHLAGEIPRRSTVISVRSDESDPAALGPLARKDIFYTASLQNIPLFNADEREYRRSMVIIPEDQAVDDAAAKGRCGFWDMIGCSEEMKDMMDCGLMVDVIFQLFAISNLLTSIGLCVPYVFLPNRAKKLGMDVNQGAFLISIIGISNTIGRIVFGFLADFKWVNRLMLYNTVLVLCGVSSLLSALCYNYALMATYAATFGLTIGVYICLTPIVLVDLLGLAKLSNAFGLVLLYQGIGAVVGPPMAGAVYDSTEDYNDSFYLMGVCIIVSGAMLYVLPCIKRRRRRRNRQLLLNASSTTTTPATTPTTTTTMLTT